MERQQNVFLGVVPRLASVPGCARRRLTFFCFAKRKQAKKKRAEVRAASRCLALLASDGVGLNSPSAQTTPALIRQPLRCSARPHGKGAGALPPESVPLTKNAADLALPVRQRWPLGVTR
jgi:hypothetical protein